MKSINTMNMSQEELIAFVTGATSTNGEVLCANPYNNINLPFYYFSSAEEYREKLKAAQELDTILNYCEDFEHELMFIDGEGSQQLLDSCRTVDEYFQTIEELQSLSDTDQVAIDYLIHNGRDFQYALEHYEEVMVTDEYPEDHAYDYAEDMGLTGLALQYFDTKSFALDCFCSGEWDKFGEYLILNACYV